MFTSNPFAEISGFLSPDFMQAYVIIMVVLVAGGTLYDIIHKKSAKYFFKNWQQQKNSGARQVGGGEVVALAVRSAVVDGLMSGEFCNARRRIAHLLTMYGFLAHVIAHSHSGVLLSNVCHTCARHLALNLVYRRSTGLCWWLLVLVLHSSGCCRRRSLAISYCACRLVHPFATHQRGVGSGLGVDAGNRYVRGKPYVCVIPNSDRSAFGSVPWSKFSHMFFKPAAALQKRIAEADGSRSNLPAPADKPEIFGSNNKLPRQY